MPTTTEKVFPCYESLTRTYSESARPQRTRQVHSARLSLHPGPLSMGGPLFRLLGRPGLRVRSAGPIMIHYANPRSSDGQFIRRFRARQTDSAISARAGSVCIVLQVRNVSGLCA